VDPSLALKATARGPAPEGPDRSYRQPRHEAVLADAWQDAILPGSPVPHTTSPVFAVAGPDPQASARADQGV